MFNIFKNSEQANKTGELTGRYLQQEQLIKLRNVPAEIDSATITEIITDKNFYHKKFNPDCKRTLHTYKEMKLHKCKVVVDNQTKLMWQKETSKMWMNYPNAEKWIGDLNEKHWAGFTDWRMPTVEEALSLLQPGIYGNRTIINFINPVFDFVTWTIWTSDLNQNDASQAFIIDYGEGSWSAHNFTSTFFVRAVRNFE